MKNKKKIAILAVVALALTVGVTSTYAYSADRQAAREAVEAGDYSAWAELTAGKPIADKIDEAGFAKLTEAHKLMQEGKYEEAKEIKKELGLKMGPAKRMHLKAHFNPEKREAVQTALDAGDYSAWFKAVGEDSPISEKINEDNFSQLVKAHELRQEARSIMEELGIEKGHK